MQAVFQIFRDNPELAIFLTLALGFFLGNLRFAWMEAAEAAGPGISKGPLNAIAPRSWKR